MTPAGATLTLRSTTPEVTRAMAGVIAEHLEPGDLVTLTGELGAGKTCFVQGAAAALGVEDRVKSPSFMLRRDYDGRVGITHLDVYRMETLDEVRDLGHDDPGQQDRITFIEWGDAVRPLLPDDHLEVELQLPPPGSPPPGAPREPAGGDDPAQADGCGSRNGWEPRTVILRAHGPAWSRRLNGLRRDCDQWVAA